MSMLADFDPSTASDIRADAPAGAQPQTSYFAGPDAARRAVEMALPLITQAMTRPQEVGDSGFLHIVVHGLGLVDGLLDRVTQFRGFGRGNCLRLWWFVGGRWGRFAGGQAQAEQGDAGQAQQ